MEAIAIALGTWFVGFNIVNAKGINKRTDPLRKAYQIGATDDVQTQFPVEIEAWGKSKSRKIRFCIGNASYIHLQEQ